MAAMPSSPSDNNMLDSEPLVDPETGTTEDASDAEHNNNSNDDDELLLSTDPVDTAYSKPARRRRTFGRASSPTTTSDATGDNNGSSNQEDPTFSQMAQAVSHDNSDNAGMAEAPSTTKHAWELDSDDEDGASDNEMLPETQDSTLSKETTTVEEGDEVTEEEAAATVSSPKRTMDDEPEASSSDGETEDKEHDSAAANTSNEEPAGTAEGGVDKATLPEETGVTPADDTASPAKNPNEQPDEEDLFLSLDNLFNEADAETVTVRQIVSALEAEYGVTLTKATKKQIRERLTGLIQGDITPLVGASEENAGNVSDIQADEESSSEEEEESSDDEEEAGSEYEDEEEEKQAQRAAKKKQAKEAREAKAKLKKASKSKSSSGKTGSSRSSSNSRRKSLRKPKTKKASIHAHAEKLRQKRMQELRVRNEELQLQQSEEDRKRAEMIAAKFETNTDDKRWQRLEDRLDLLQKLDQKRLQIIELDDIPLKQLQKLEDEKAKAAVAAVLKAKEEEKEQEADEEDSDSDDDIELEIEGCGDNKKSVFPSMAKKSTALSVLDLADIASPMAKKNPKHKKAFLANLTNNSNRRQQQLSPSRNSNARAMLRSNLLQKQRKMGNMWLARELGYKNEKEHLRDCMEVEKKKRDMVLQREAQRLAANERAQLRERLQEPVFDEEEEAELEETMGDASNAAAEGDDDEEMALAKQIEEETEGASANKDLAPSESGSTDEPAESLAEGDNTDELANSDIQSLPKEGANAEAGHEKQFQDESQEQTNCSNPETSFFPVTEDPEDDSQLESFPDAQPGSFPVTLGTDMTQDVSDKEPETQATSVTVDTLQDTTLGATGQNGEESDIETQAPFTKPATSEAGEAELEETVEKSSEPSKAASGSTGDDIVDTDDEQEFDDKAESEDEVAPEKQEKKDRNAGWKAMLEHEAKKMKKSKVRNDFLETEADEEEEEEVAGLEDFGFSVHKKKDKDDDEDAVDDEINADDLKHVVDDVSDDEGDEETGEKMRVAMAQKEEKERHKEMLRRMREGYDGRRGGIAGGGSGARGMHRFDQLVAADNRESAKQLGLLNEDELDSDDEGTGEKKGADEDEDENVLLDKMLKDRFLHRSSVELEEDFSEDEEDDENNDETNENKAGDDEAEQEKLAKRFAKRARMERLMEEYGHEEQFSHSRLIEEDTTMKDELKRMKVCLRFCFAVFSFSLSYYRCVSANNRVLYLFFFS